MLNWRDPDYPKFSFFHNNYDVNFLFVLINFSSQKNPFNPVIHKTKEKNYSKKRFWNGCWNTFSNLWFSHEWVSNMKLKWIQGQEPVALIKSFLELPQDVLTEISALLYYKLIMSWILNCRLCLYRLFYNFLCPNN